LTFALSCFGSLFLGISPASAGSFVEPSVLSSSNGVLDILMIAKPQPVPSIVFTPPGGAAMNPTGWVYEICPRPASGLTCPQGGNSTVSDYGGTRLALKKGDTLKIRLVNKLPKMDPLKVRHVNDPGDANIFLNPTNIHTHGLLTPARAATVGNPTFGDFIFVSVFNSTNGIPVPQSTHQHGPIVMDTTDYVIPIPANHPSGLFWLHPHVHGIALNQVVQGLAAIITIGNVGDYALGDAVKTPFPAANIRHLTLKDMQVLAAGTIKFDPSGPQPVVNGEVLNQQDPRFCTQFRASGEVRHGSCPGVDNNFPGPFGEPPGSVYIGSQWYFTVSGQQYPTIRLTDPDGEIWRLTNASSDVSYDLKLTNDADQQPMIMQLLAVDGISIHLPQDTPPNSMVTVAGGRFHVVSCPLVTGNLSSLPVCTDEFVMMPSARAEIWVSYRNSNGQLTLPPPNATATFRTVGLSMGTGDQWPEVDLAKVEFAQNGTRQYTAAALDINGEASSSQQGKGIFAQRVPGATATPLPAGCGALAPGHRRRIFLGLASFEANNLFGMGYEEVDQNGNVVPGSQKPSADALEQFDPTHNVICLPLGPGQMPVHETWEIVTLSLYNHNFHTHQARFQLEGPNGPNPSGLIQDNIPLGVATPYSNPVFGVCTIAQWRSGFNGGCVSTPVVVDVPFSQLGEFAYHCHLLRHEDGGMMAKIQVVAAPY